MYIHEHIQGWVIPSGEPILIWGGQEVEIIYDYTTSCTIRYEDRWVYLGLASRKLKVYLPSDEVDYINLTPSEKHDAWYLQLKHLYDPELPLVNIVDLGLIYSVEALGDNGIKLLMTPYISFMWYGASSNSTNQRSFKTLS